MTASDDEVDFESLMAHDGVVAYGRGGGKRKPTPHPKQATPNPAAPKPGGLSQSPRPGKPPSPSPAPAPTPDRAKLQAEAAALRLRAETSEKRTKQLEDQLSQAEARLQERESELTEEIRILAAEREGLDRRQKSLRAELEEARSELEDKSTTSLEDIFRRRGLAKRDEDTVALRLLLDSRPDELLATLQIAEVTALRQLLSNRLMLCCMAEQCLPQEDEELLLVPVPSARCEICGGSNIQAKFKAFIDTTRKAELDCVVIVGGSPAYRKKLRSLSREAKELRLDLISGTQSRTKRKAEADMRRADLVVLWGASLLDHSTSDNYRPGVGRAALFTVHDRGITRMLDEVRQFIANGGHRADPFELP